MPDGGSKSSILRRFTRKWPVVVVAGLLYLGALEELHDGHELVGGLMLGCAILVTGVVVAMMVYDHFISAHGLDEPQHPERRPDGRADHERD